MASDEGASPKELLFEACRRNNTSLLESLLTSLKTPEAIASLINESRDGVGNYALHVAAASGSYEVLDTLLDQSHVETDPLDRMEGETPLFKAIRYTNSLSQEDWPVGQAIVELLIDAGCDPRVRNKGKLKAVQVVDPRNEGLRAVLARAEYAALLGEEGGGEEGSEGESD